MKQRLISAAVGFVLLGFVFWLFDTIFLNIVMAAIGCLALFELARALGLKGRTVLWGLTGLYLCTYLFLPVGDLAFVYATLFTMFIVVMFSKEKLTFKEGGAFVAAASMVGLGLGAIIKARDLSPYGGDGIFMFCVCLGLGWVCDTLAFTFGSLFGKRKLCPSISPKKTVEGAIGGVVGTPVVAVIAYILYANLAESSVFAGTVSPVTILCFVFMGAAGAVVGMLGDLAASFIKRECGIKDFGNIMPGHGGAMDRIDSVLFTGVFSYFCFNILINYVI